MPIVVTDVVAGYLSDLLRDAGYYVSYHSSSGGIYFRIDITTFWVSLNESDIHVISSSGIGVAGRFDYADPRFPDKLFAWARAIAGVS